MKAVDTNVIVRFLVNDDKTQGLKVRESFERAERVASRLFITTPVVLETIWVLSSVYTLTRDEVLHALELLAQMPVLEFQDYDGVQQLIRGGRTTTADLPDLLIGISGVSSRAESTLTFDKRLTRTGLF